MTFVIFLTRGRMLGWNSHPIPPEACEKGWRPYVWTPNLVDAEKFGSREGASAFAKTVMRHDDWSVVQISGEEVFA